MRSRTVNSSALLGSPCSTAISAPLGKIGGVGPHWMSSAGPVVASRESNGVSGALLLLASREHAAVETIAILRSGRVRARMRMAVSPSIGGLLEHLSSVAIGYGWPDRATSWKARGFSCPVRQFWRASTVLLR